MATTTAGVSFTVAMGMYSSGQRFQYVIRYGRTGGNPFGTGIQIWQDVKSRLSVTVIPLWQAAMSSEIEFVGWSVESVVAGGIIPYRENYPLATFPGLQNAPMYSQNVSMLGVGYSADQIATGDKLRTAKTFLGPPPEDQIDTQVLKAAYQVGALQALVDSLFEPWTGAFTGTNWARVFGTLSTPVPLAGDVQYPVSTWAVRQTVFTQARRLTPII